MRTGSEDLPNRKTGIELEDIAGMAESIIRVNGTHRYTIVGVLSDRVLVVDPPEFTINYLVRYKDMLEYGQQCRIQGYEFSRVVFITESRRFTGLIDQSRKSTWLDENFLCIISLTATQEVEYITYELAQGWANDTVYTHRAEQSVNTAAVGEVIVPLLQWFCGYVTVATSLEDGELRFVPVRKP